MQIYLEMPLLEDRSIAASGHIVAAVQNAGQRLQVVLVLLAQQNTNYKKYQDNVQYSFSATKKKNKKINK
jgi:hypothetical protein